MTDPTLSLDCTPEKGPTATDVLTWGGWSIGQSCVGSTACAPFSLFGNVYWNEPGLMTEGIDSSNVAFEFWLMYCIRSN